MNCPNCGCSTTVRDVCATGNAIYRCRRCKKCKYTFITSENMIADDHLSLYTIRKRLQAELEEYEEKEIAQ